MNAIAIFSIFSFSYMLVEIKTPLIIQFCDFFELYDESDYYRKRHASGIPRLGGLGIFSTFMAMLMVVANVFSPDILALICSCAIIFIVGLKDDIGGGLGPAEKICAQVAASVILSCWGDYKLNVVGLGFDELNCWLSPILSMFAIIIVVNAFNLIDGLDGLAGAIAFLANLIFGTLFLYIGNMTWVLISFALTGAIAGFLRYNYSPGTIFMGDSGAMLLGLISVASVMKLLSVYGAGAGVISWSGSVLGICISVLIIPVFDLFRVFAFRILRCKSPFVGDRTHIHHRLKALKMQDWKVVSVLICFNVWVVVLSMCLAKWGNTVVITMSFISCVVGNASLSYVKGRRM